MYRCFIGSLFAGIFLHVKIRPFSFLQCCPAKGDCNFPKRQHRLAIHAPDSGIWVERREIRHIFPLNVVQMYRVSDRRGVTNVATIL